MGPAALMERYISRIGYMHFKDINPVVKADVLAKNTGFYDACGQGIFCNLGDGDVNFPRVREILIENGFEGWCTVEQDCGPTRPDTTRIRYAMPRSTALISNPSVLRQGQVTWQNSNGA